MSKNKITNIILGLLILLGLYIISINNYLLFHSIAEGFSIVIALIIFIIAWNSKNFVNNSFFLFLGIAMLFIGSVDFLHTVSYKGMAIFDQNGTNLPTQLWVGARYVQSISFVIAPLFFRKRINDGLIFIIYSLVLLLLLLSIFYWNIFPVCFNETTGLTPFKKISEYLISLILLTSILHLSKHRDKFERHVFLWIITSVSLAILSELAFSSYANAYSHFNLIGHYLKIVSFWFLYKAFVATNLNEPFNLIFRDLKLNEEKFRSLFKNMNNGFAWHKVIFDAKGQSLDYIFLDVNDAFEKITGLNKEGIIGRKVTEVIPGIEIDPADWIGRYGRVAMTGKTERFEEYSETLKRWFSVLTYSTEKGYFATIFEDITGKKLAERAMIKEQDRLEIRVQERTRELSKANELLKTIIDYMPAMLCLFDPEGRIHVINNEFKNRTGWDIEEIDKSRIMKSNGSDTEDYKEIRTFIKEAKPGWNDFLLKMRNREVLETSWASASLSDGSVIAIGIDITDLKKMDMKLLNYMEQLEQSNTDLEEFAYIASHDLQEPLRKIRTFGDLLSSRFSDSLNETGRDYVERMQNASLRMQMLIDSLLTYSRISTRAKQISMVDLNKSVTSALSNLELRIEEEKARMEIDDLPVIEADIIQMTQLFQNLIGNALKFHRENIPPHIKIYAHKSEERRTTDSLSWRIYIEDNGIGFEEKYLKQIFIPFQRLHGRGIYEGVGMGLAICKKIVARHNGHIIAESAAGHGTTYIITLPEKNEDT